MTAEGQTMLPPSRCKLCGPGALFQTVLTTLDLPDPRASQRFACNLPASYRPISLLEERLWPARVLDISSGGIRLLAGNPLELGRLLLVQLQHQVLPRPLLVKVVHLQRQQRKQWVLGGPFVGPLSEVDIQKFLASPTL